MPPKHEDFHLSEREWTAFTEAASSAAEGLKEEVRDLKKEVRELQMKNAVAETRSGFWFGVLGALATLLGMGAVQLAIRIFHP